MRSLCFFFLCFLCLLISAQEITILDVTTDKTISGVAVFNADKTKSVFSGLDGKITLDIFSKDEKIIFQHITHVRVTYIKYRINKIIFLKPIEKDINEIVISA